MDNFAQRIFNFVEKKQFFLVNYQLLCVNAPEIENLESSDTFYVKARFLEMVLHINFFKIHLEKVVLLILQN